jgi:nucleoside-diphosphate-sugar epimerase
LKKILITGASGFVGKNILKSLIPFYSFNCLSRNDLKRNNIVINEEVIIHLAGLAHDTKNNANFDQYYDVNTKLTKYIWDAFLNSTAECFIYVSSIKAARDNFSGILTEESETMPTTPYGKSKIMAEYIILNSELPTNKRFYILRPSMIYGEENKGNLNLLYKYVSMKLPWILTNFKNNRTLCSINNFNFIIKNLVEKKNIVSGVYNVCNSENISTNEIVTLIGKSLNRKTLFLKIPKFIIIFSAKLGDFFGMPFNSNNLTKLTENFIVSNKKILLAIKAKLPDTTEDSLLDTFKSFNIKQYAKNPNG